MQQDVAVCRYLFTAKLLYMFRTTIAPIIRSTQKYSCSLWYRSYYLGSKLVQTFEYDLYQRLQLHFCVLLMMGAMDARNMYSNLAVNEYLHTVASCWISSTQGSFMFIIFIQCFSVSVFHCWPTQYDHLYPPYACFKISLFLPSVIPSSLPAYLTSSLPVAYPGILFGGGVQQIQLRTENKQNGDLGAVAPQSGVLEAAVIWYKKFHFIQ